MRTVRYYHNLIILLGIFALLQPCLGAVRLGLITHGRDDVDSDLAWLLETSLSQNDELELLERGKMDSILAEHRLSLAGLSDRRTAVEAGRLLRADALLLLTTDVDSENDGLVRVRLIETAHGLRILDYYESGKKSEVEATAARIAEQVLSSAGKLALQSESLIPVGIIGVRRVQLGSDYQLLLRAMPGLLSVRLSKEPNYVVLERGDLDDLVKEKTLTQGPDGKFWNSAILIDGRLHSENGGGVTLRLSLKDGRARETKDICVPVDPNEPAEAIDAAVKMMAEKIFNAKSVQPWQPDREAREFFRQGKLLTEHRRHVEAGKVFETARAIDPSNVYYTGAVFENEWSLRILEGNAMYTDTELVEIVTLLVRQIESEYDKGAVTDEDVIRTWGESLGTGYNWKAYFTNCASVSNEAIRAVNRTNRRIWVRTMKKAIRGRTDVLGDYRRAIIIPVCWAYSDDPQELFEHYKEVTTGYIMPVEMGGYRDLGLTRHNYCRRVIWQAPLCGPSVKTLQKGLFKGRAEQAQKAFERYLLELTESKDPLVKYVSCLTLAKYYMGYDTRDYETSQQYCFRAAEILEKELGYPNELAYDGDKRSLRDELKYCMSIGRVSPARIVDLLERLCEPLIENEDAANLAAWSLGRRFAWGRFGLEDKEACDRYIKLMGRVADVLERNPDNSTITQALGMITDSMNAYKKRHPELATETVVDRIAVRMLVKKSDWSHKHTFDQMKVFTDGRMCWIAVGNRLFDKSNPVGLMGLDLDNKRVSALWHADSGLSSFPTGDMTGVAIGKHKSYVAVHDIGLVEFPGSTRRGRGVISEPVILTCKDGLPSVDITSITACGDKIMVAYGDEGKESGLGLYDPVTKNWRSILCSTLKQDNIFSTGFCYEIKDLTAGPNDDFFFQTRFFSGNMQLTSMRRPGMWRMLLNPLRLERMLFDEEPPRDSKLLSGEIVPDEKCFWVRRAFFIVRFDPVRFDSDYLLGRSTTVEVSPVQATSRPRSFFSDDSWRRIAFGPCVTGGNLDLSTAAVHKNMMWVRYGLTRFVIMKRGEDFDKATYVDNDILDGSAVLKFFNTPYGLLAVGDGCAGLIE